MVSDGWSLLDLVWYTSLTTRSLIMALIPIQSILGKLLLVSVGDTGSIPHSMCNTFSGAPGDWRPGAGDGCRMWLKKLVGIGMVPSLP